MSAHPAYLLPIQEVDKATEIRIMAFAVLDLMRIIDPADPNLCDEALAGTSMLLQGMFADPCNHRNTSTLRET